jgi:hypothetical protein
MKYAISPAEGAAECVSALLHRGETHRDNFMIVNTRVRMTALGLEAKGKIMTAQLYVHMLYTHVESTNFVLQLD